MEGPTHNPNPARSGSRFAKGSHLKIAPQPRRGANQPWSRSGTFVSHKMIGVQEMQEEQKNTAQGVGDMEMASHQSSSRFAFLLYLGVVFSLDKLDNFKCSSMILHMIHSEL